MTNSEIVDRILTVVERCRSGDGSLRHVEEVLELYEPLFEGVDYWKRRALHDFMQKIYQEDVSPLEEELLGIRPS